MVDLNTERCESRRAYDGAGGERGQYEGPSYAKRDRVLEQHIMLPAASQMQKHDRSRRKALEYGQAALHRHSAPVRSRLGVDWYLEDGTAGSTRRARLRDDD